jgi:hypothetical protein
VSMITPPGFLQAGSYSALLDRQYSTNHHFQPKGGDPSRCRSGILPAPDAWSGAVSLAGLNVTVSPFRCIIENSNASGAGDYKGASLTPETRTMDAASTTLNRIDVIGVRVRDAFYSGTDNDVDVVLVKGAPAAGTPAVPTLPNGYMAMYQLTLNANATTPTVVDVRVRTSALGAPYIPFTGQVAASGVYPGETRYLPASGAMPVRQTVWGADGQWHGLTTYGLDMGAWVLTSSTADRIIATLVMADPGYPYRLVWSGAVHAGFDANNGWNFTPRQGTSAAGFAMGGVGAWETRDPNYFTGTNSIPITGRTSTDITGGQTISLWAQRKLGAATQGMSVSGASLVSCLVVPV